MQKVALLLITKESAHFPLEWALTISLGLL